MRALALILIAQLAPPVPADVPISVGEPKIVIQMPALDAGTIFEVPEDLTVAVKAPAWIYNQPAHEALDNELKRLQYVEAHPPTAQPDVKAYLIGGGIVATVFTAIGVAIGAGAAAALQKKP